MPAKHPDTRSVPHACEDFKPAREVDAFTALLSIVDFIDHDLSGIQSLPELKIALVIWRKTHGWGKTADAIGDRELAGRVGMHRRNLRRTTGKMGRFASVEHSESRGTKCRTVYRWPVNERVSEAVEKARGGGIKSTPGGGINMMPGGWHQGDATQSIPDQSVSESERSKSDFCQSIAKTSDEQAGLALVRSAIEDFMGERLPEAFAYIPSEVMKVAAAPVAEVVEFLRLRKPRFGHGTKNAPRKWGWFPKTIGGEFNRRREQAKARAESPKAHWSDPEYRPPDIPVDWSAIELPDADPPPAPKPHHMEHGGAVLRRLAVGR
jgi:hypothetical protein